MSEKPQIFIYKLTTDNGAAPCIDDGLISLCICKPLIRQAAEKGDWIIGMGGKSVSELKDRLIYIMQVKAVVEGGDYYAPGSKYEKRPDCIYKWDETGNKFIWKKGAKYHSEKDLKHDLGSYPEYKRARCLVGHKFVYFGYNKGPDIVQITDIYNALPRGHKKNHDADIYDRLNCYIHWIMDEFGEGSHGNPTHSYKSKKCDGEEYPVMKSSCGKSYEKSNPDTCRY